MLSDPTPVYELFHGYSDVLRLIISIDRSFNMILRTRSVMSFSRPWVKAFEASSRWISMPRFLLSDSARDKAYSWTLGFRCARRLRMEAMAAWALKYDHLVGIQGTLGWPRTLLDLHPEPYHTGSVWAPSSRWSNSRPSPCLYMPWSTSARILARSRLGQLTDDILIFWRWTTTKHCWLWPGGVL